MTKLVRIDGISKPSDNGSWTAGRGPGIEPAGTRLRDRRRRLGAAVVRFRPAADVGWIQGRSTCLGAQIGRSCCLDSIDSNRHCRCAVELPPAASDLGRHK